MTGVMSFLLIAAPSFRLQIAPRDAAARGDERDQAPQQQRGERKGGGTDRRSSTPPSEIGRVTNGMSSTLAGG